jgi:hypothetical protein
MGTPSTDSAAMKQIIDALREGGCQLLRVNNGEDEIEVSTRAEAITELTAVDSAHLFVSLPNSNAEGWVWFVQGNDPEEVAADYTTNLSDWIDPVTEEWWA